ncbi:EamA-like transporter family protein [Halanaerobium congolense]|uniref:EamA-like transporter family protein n=1 Tax=Halanaerobium congolense TaxID=54121 RepID=A0A1G8R1U2_9FIRM|nr:EamA family transporter [Halanaerobium congolense]SDJ10813.1 EamA-like transporter family protein [Halanaerobium congolense]SET65756.1 EamA-like transporter family protein [Halanaerobium congolense]
MENNFLRSIRKNWKGIVIMSFASFLTASGQLFWKISLGEEYLTILLGFLCYGLGSILMIIAFNFGSFSVIHPMLSLSYITAIVFGNIFLNETLTNFQLSGIFLIVVGIILIGGGDY